MNNQPESRTNRHFGETAESRSPHVLILEGRKRLEVTGVRDVLRFDEMSAELATDLGDLIVDGSNLRIEVFDTERGIVTLCGEIRTLDYFETKEAADRPDKKRGFFGKR